MNAKIGVDLLGVLIAPTPQNMQLLHAGKYDGVLAHKDGHFLMHLLLDADVLDLRIVAQSGGTLFQDAVMNLFRSVSGALRTLFFISKNG